MEKEIANHFTGIHFYTKPLDDNGINSILTQGKYGLVIIPSKYTEEDTPSESDIALRNDILHSLFCFTEVFVPTIAGSEIPYNPTYAVYCIDRKGRALDFKELIDFAISKSKEYNTGDLCVQEPGYASIYYLNTKREKTKTNAIKFDGMRVFNCPATYTEKMRRRCLGEIFV